MVFAIHWHESAMGVHVFTILNPPSHLPPHPIPQGHPGTPALSTLSYASNLDWQDVSHMIIYMSQCYSLKSSHTCLLPQSPRDCSIHLCLFCYLAYKVIITICLLVNYLYKNETRTLSNTIQKKNSKWIKDLNVRPETIKLLEESIDKTLSDINHSWILYDPPPRVMEIKAKIKNGT